MDGGYILIHRKIRDWQWYRVGNMFYFFAELLFMANYEDKKWKNLTIPRGSLITSLRHLSGITGMTLDQIRTAISRLEESGEITHKSTHHFTMITIVKYDSYQIRPNLNPTPNPISIPSQSQQLNKVNKEILCEDDKLHHKKDGSNGRYLNEKYRVVEEAYKRISGLSPVGKEWGRIRRVTKELFDAGRTTEEIIGCMEYCNIRFKDWSINAVLNNMPAYLKQPKTLMEEFSEEVKL